MFSRTSKLTQIVLSFGIFAFLAVSFLSLSHFGMSMGMDGDMSMSSCPFMNEMTMCDMSPFEHMGIWQSLFANILTPENAILVLLLLVALSFPLWAHLFSPPKHTFTQIRHIHDDSQRGTLSFLQQLFSQGILNPKLF